MAGKMHAEKQKVIHFIQEVPYTDEQKAAWDKLLEDGEVNEAMLNDMHTALMEIPAEKFDSDWMRAKYSTDLAGIIRQWRMKNAQRQFKHGR
jgi:hypothetical protein